MRDFGRYVVTAIWNPCVSVLMNLTGPCTVRAADYQRHFEYFLQYLAWHRRDISLTRAAQRRLFETEIFKYNLVSVAELASLNFESRFGRHQSSVHGPVGMHVPLIHTCNVYAIDVASNSNHFSFASISKMTNEEKAHLYCSHVISEAKLIHLSKSGVMGLPKGLKKRGFPCTICQHAKIVRKAAAPAATGSDPHCISFDMIDMSKIPTLTGSRYCTMIVERETRFAHIQLHATKDEIVQVFKRVLPMLTKKPLIIKSDCAPEYHTPELLSLLTEYGVKEVRHSNEHCQAQNGMVEKIGDTLGRGLRGELLQSGLPLSMWGASAILITDIYNSCPHSSLDNDTPFFCRTGRLPDFSLFQTFWLWYGCIPWKGPCRTQETCSAGRKVCLHWHGPSIWAPGFHGIFSQNQPCVCRRGL